MSEQNVGSEHKLGLFALIALVISTMIGAGIFSLPQNMANGASAGAISIAWAITGVGMTCLVLTLFNLSRRRPELSGGLFSYAQAGFGDLVGFYSVWGYWLSNILANVSYGVLFFSALSFFVDTPDQVIFGSGNTLWSLLGASAMIWCMHALVLRGVELAALINMFATIAKVLPILFFAVATLLAFNIDQFSMDFWGEQNPALGSVMDQVKNSMAVTLWVFIGIEGALVVSGRAKRQKDVGVATVVALFCALGMYLMVTLFSLGVMSQAEIAELQNPSMAKILEQVVGPWGAALINIGLMVSIAAALLGWTLVVAEVPYIASKSGLFPKSFSRENRHGSAVVSLWVSNGIIQFFLIVTFLQESSYLALVNVATSAVLVPYLFASGYGLKLAWRREAYLSGECNNRHILLALVAVGYGLWLVTAAGTQYLLLCCLLYLPGMALYRKARMEWGEKGLNHGERILLLVMLVGSVTALLMIISGDISLV